MEDTIKVLSGERFETTDMSIFKHLEANREVADKRCEKIEKSVKKIGWIIPEIIVNENMEIIDGQGRVEVAKRHGFPVRYQMIPGIGADECISMNLDQTNWKMQDFCKSWEKRGNENYARLNSLVESFKGHSFTVIVCAATGLASVPATPIKEGRLLCSEDQLKVAKKALTWLNRFDKVFASMTNATALLPPLRSGGDRMNTDIETWRRKHPRCRYCVYYYARNAPIPQGGTIQSCEPKEIQ